MSQNWFDFSTDSSVVPKHLVIIRMILQTVHIDSLLQQIELYILAILCIYAIRGLCNIVLNNKVKTIAIAWLITNIIVASDPDYYAHSFTKEEL